MAKRHKKTSGSVKRVRVLYSQAEEMLIDLFIEEIKRVMRKHKNLDHCCIGMGSVFFVDSKGNYIYTEQRAYLRKIDNMLDEWDGIFGLSGLATSIERGDL